MPTKLPQTVSAYCYHGLMNETMNCLYNVNTRTGVDRMTGRQIVRIGGLHLLDSDAVIHSEWCPRHKNEPKGTWAESILPDPFMN